MWPSRWPNSSKRAAIYQSLARLDDRALADLGLERHDIAAVARMGAELGPEGATLADVVARARAPRAERPSTTDRYANFWKVEPLAYTPADLDRYMAEAQRLRGETLAAGWRWLGRKFVDLARPAKQALLDSPAWTAGAGRAGLAPGLSSDAHRARVLLRPRVRGGSAA